MANETQAIILHSLEEIKKQPSIKELAERVAKIKNTKIVAIKNEATRKIAKDFKLECKNARQEIDQLRKDSGEPYRLVVEGINAFFRIMLDDVKKAEDAVEEKLAADLGKNPTAFANSKVEKGAIYYTDFTVIDDINLKVVAEAALDKNSPVPLNCIAPDHTNIKKAIEVGVKIPGVKWHTENKIKGRG